MHIEKLDKEIAALHAEIAKRRELQSKIKQLPSYFGVKTFDAVLDLLKTYTPTTTAMPKAAKIAVAKVVSRRRTFFDPLTPERKSEIEAAIRNHERPVDIKRRLKVPHTTFFSIKKELVGKELKKAIATA